ncbi:hypothetical protein Acr_25g0001720 [Actinidia rufa]|uniref:Uncharacterized protein n=1 Tax=Actinidia rufa TaxID=165716 RepID=A0A7J0GY63_9ERIC|nr:hypothetical protein Acr_25g0001720 [Actinidia rufa]
MLPQDLVDLVVKDPVEASDLIACLQRVMANSMLFKKHSFELKKAQEKANSLEVELKKTKENLAAAEKACDANADVAAMELGTPADHSAWTTPAPEAILSDSLEPYLPMILPSFNEEEYTNHPAKGRAEGGDEVGDIEAEGELGDKVRVSGARD